jgi:hypothetical protein
MNPWIKVVTHPLGLAGFALFLVFSFLAKNRQRKKPSWLASFAFGMAAISLLAGVGLAYRQTTSQLPASQEQRIGAIQQNSGGESGSNVAGVQGNVSVSVTTSPEKDRAGVGPLTAQDVLSILASRSKTDEIIAEIHRRGLAFHMNAELTERFRRAGATAEVLNALKKDQKQ